MPTKDEIIDIILNSDSEHDWEDINIPAIKLDGEGNIYLPGKRVKYYKNDVLLRFEESGEANDNFIEEWANDFPDPRAYSYIYMLYYGSTPIKEFFLVAVDGWRALLPIPDLSKLEVKSKLKVKKLDFKVAKIHNEGDLENFNNYMKRVNFTVEDT